MTDKERIEALTEANAYLLREITAIATESMERAMALARLEAEVMALRERTGGADAEQV